MAKHYYISYSVRGFEEFHSKPYLYFTQTTGAMARLGMNDPNSGWGKRFAEEIPLLIQEYQQLLAQYRAALGTSEQKPLWRLLEAKEEQLGDVWEELRKYVNAHPNHIPQDNIGSELPSETIRKKETPAPIMNDSNPVVDNVVDHAADRLTMTFHDSADVEKKHKIPDRQKLALLYVITDVADAIPTREFVVVNGQMVTATRSPLRHDFGVANQGKRLSYVAYWVNTNNQEGRHGELISIILT